MTEKLAPVASLVSAHHLRVRAGLVGPVFVYNDWAGYHVYLHAVWYFGVLAL